MVSLAPIPVSAPPDSAETERESLRTGLARADRLATLGEIAGAVGHEISNPLGSVINNLAVLADVIRGLAPLIPAERVCELEELLGETREGTERIRDSVWALLALGRSDDEEPPQRLDVNRTVAQALVLALPDQRRRRRVLPEYGRVPPLVVSELRLCQLVVHMVLNALGTADGGSSAQTPIHVATRAERSAVVVEVRADGPEPASARDLGAPPSIASAVRGGRVGLAVCRELAIAIGARLDLGSSPSTGVVLRLTLPLGARSSRVPGPRG